MACSGCNTQGHLPIVCGQCRVQHYCSPECHQRHWYASHYNSCLPLRADLPYTGPFKCSVIDCENIAMHRCEHCHKKVLCLSHMHRNNGHRVCEPLPPVYATRSTNLQEIMYDLYSAKADTRVVPRPGDKQFCPTKTSIDDLLCYVVENIMPNMSPLLTETDLRSMTPIARQQECERVVNSLKAVANKAKDDEHKWKLANDAINAGIKPYGVKAITPSSFSKYQHLLPR